MQEFIRQEIPVTNPPLVHYKRVCDGAVVGYYSPEDMKELHEGLKKCLLMNISDEIRVEVQETIYAIEKALNA